MWQRRPSLVQLWNLYPRSMECHYAAWIHVRVMAASVSCVYVAFAMRFICFFVSFFLFVISAVVDNGSSFETASRNWKTAKPWRSFMTNALPVIHSLVVRTKLPFPRSRPCLLRIVRNRRLSMALFPRTNPKRPNQPLHPLAWQILMHPVDALLVMKLYWVLLCWDFPVKIELTTCKPMREGTWDISNLASRSRKALTTIFVDLLGKAWNVDDSIAIAKCSCCDYSQLTICISLSYTHSHPELCNTMFPTSSPTRPEPEMCTCYDCNQTVLNTTVAGFT